MRELLGQKFWNAIVWKIKKSFGFISLVASEYSNSFTHFVEVRSENSVEFLLLIFSAFTDLWMCVRVSVCIAFLSVFLFFSKKNCSCFSRKQLEREQEQIAFSFSIWLFSILKCFSCFAREKTVESYKKEKKNRTSVTLI